VEYTFKGKVTQHKLQPHDEVYSVVEIQNPTHKIAITMDIIVPMKFPLASVVYVSINDTEPEGGAQDV